MPALSIADTISALRPDVEPVLVGARRGVEATLLPTRHPAYRYYLLPAEPIYRTSWWKNVRWLGAGARLFVACRKIIETERPVLAVGTGGYAAGPVLLACRRRGVPVALQEQNAVPGLTTRLLAATAKQIHLGFPEAAAALRPGPETAVYAYGNPIAPPRNDVGRATARDRLGVPRKRPVCFVMGGSQGARSVNEAVAAAIDAGQLATVTLLWSTGARMWETFGRYHAPPHRLVRPFWDPVATAYAAADVVVARAGAMTVAELCAWGLPAILIPLPSAAADHQLHNARALERAGAAVCVIEGALTASSLAARVETMAASPDQLEAMGAAAAERGRPDAATRIAERLLTLVD